MFYNQISLLSVLARIEDEGYKLEKKQHFLVNYAGPSAPKTAENDNRTPTTITVLWANQKRAYMYLPKWEKDFSWLQKGEKGMTYIKPSPPI